MASDWDRVSIIVCLDIGMFIAEELKRCDEKLYTAFDEKLKIVSKLCHIPPEGIADIQTESSPDLKKPKDAKELVAACIHQGGSSVRHINY